MESDGLLLVTTSGKLSRCKLDTVRDAGRSTAGEILLKAAVKEKVMFVACRL